MAYGKVGRAFSLELLKYQFQSTAAWLQLFILLGLLSNSLRLSYD